MALEKNLRIYVSDERDHSDLLDMLKAFGLDRAYLGRLFDCIIFSELIVEIVRENNEVYLKKVLDKDGKLLDSDYLGEKWWEAEHKRGARASARRRGT